MLSISKFIQRGYPVQRCDSDPNQLRLRPPPPPFDPDHPLELTHHNQAALVIRTNGQKEIGPDLLGPSWGQRRGRANIFVALDSVG